jgi:hypothetical protein
MYTVPNAVRLLCHTCVICTEVQLGRSMWIFPWSFHFEKIQRHVCANPTIRCVCVESQTSFFGFRVTLSMDDQENEDVIDAKILNFIGSCGHDNCHLWIAYPQSLFGNWTAKPVRKCGIECAVKDRERYIPSMCWRMGSLGIRESTGWRRGINENIGRIRSNRR